MYCGSSKVTFSEDKQWSTRSCKDGAAGCNSSLFPSKGRHYDAGTDFHTTSEIFLSSKHPSACSCFLIIHHQHSVFLPPTQIHPLHTRTHTQRHTVTRGIVTREDARLLFLFQPLSPSQIIKVVLPLPWGLVKASATSSPPAESWDPTPSPTLTLLPIQNGRPMTAPTWVSCRCSCHQSGSCTSCPSVCLL